MKKLLVAAGLILSSVFLAGCNPLDLKARAGLQVITNDVPSSLFLDSKLLDKTPYINKDLKPGDYTLEIRPDNSQLATHEEKITLQKGLLTVVTWKPGDRPETSGGVIYEMEALHDHKNSEVAINTIPDGVIVHFDGEAKGFSPVLVEHVSAGQHTYEVSLPSYESQRNMINVLPGYRMDVMVKLAKQEFIPATPSAAVDTAELPSVSPSPATPSVASAAATKTTVVSPPKVKIKPTGFLNNGKEVLRVRATVGAGGAEIGFAPVGSEYPYLGETTNGWFKIQFNGAPGWISGQFGQLIQ